MYNVRRNRAVALITAGLLGAQLLSVVAPGATATAAEPTWPIDWHLNRTHDIEELSRTFDLDEDGIIDAGSNAAERLPQILNPAQYTLYVDSCAAPPGFSSVDWQLARPGEAASATASSTTCEAELVLPDKPFPDAREYVLTGTVHYPATPDQVVSTEIRVQDVFIVGLGDSYGSGEGNPLETWHFGGDDARWDNERCHRSRLSGQEQAARQLDMLAGVTVTFLHLACSGAEALEGILQPYGGLFPSGAPLPPQITQAAEYVDLSQTPGGAKRYPDVVVTSIGGNDAGFADVVKGCLMKPAWGLVPIPVFPYAVPVDFDSCYEQGEAADAFFWPGIAGLPGLYDQLATAVDGTNPSLPPLCDPNGSCDFLITEYPDGATDENGDTCGAVAGFTEDEFQWVIDTMVPELNGVIASSSAQHDWVYVDGVRDNFYEHGICADDDYLRDIAESFEIQGDQNGAFHPNSAGHLWGYGDAILDSLRESLGFPYTGVPYFGPLYGGSGQPQTCDTKVGDGNREQVTTAPATDVSGLDLPNDIAFELSQGYLPSGEAGSNSCSVNALARTGVGSTPLELRSGRPGCPDDPRPCTGSSTGSSLLRLPVWGDDFPVIDARSEADISLGAGEDGSSDFRRRSSSSLSKGTTVFLAAPANGATTVSGEIVVDLTQFSQATGAVSNSISDFRLDVQSVIDEPHCEGNECFESRRTDIAGVNLEITKYTCIEDTDLEHNCLSAHGSRTYRSTHTSVDAWAGDTVIADIDEYRDDTTVIGGSDQGVRTGSGNPLRTIRLPYTVPAGSVVRVFLMAGSYSTAGELCQAETNNFECNASARSAARVTFAPDVATGALVPLAGFQPPTPIPADTTAPVVTTAPSGTAGSNGWYRSNVELGVHATDEASAVESVTYALDGGEAVTVAGDTATVAIAGDGTHTVTHHATDAAGNAGSPTTTTVQIDAAAPTLTVSTATGAQYQVGADVPTGLVCTDATSGVATCTGPAKLYTGAPGSYVATFAATDVAGNPTTTTQSYSVVAPPPPPPPPPATRDRVALTIPQLGFAIDGTVTSGGFTITRDSSGRPTSVSGSATIAGPKGGATTVRVAVVKLLGVWVGGVNVVDPTTGTNVTATTQSRSGVTASGTNAVIGTSSSTRPARTVNWTVTDLV